MFTKRDKIMRFEIVIGIHLHEFYFIRYLHYELRSNRLKTTFVYTREMVFLTSLTRKSLHPDIEEEQIGVQ